MNTATEQERDLIVNGDARRVPAGYTLADLLRSLDVDPEAARGVAVAVNEEVVRRQAWAGRTLQEGDRVEVITASAGG